MAKKRTKKQTKKQKIHPVKSRKAGISPKAKLFNRVKKKKKISKPLKVRKVKASPHTKNLVVGAKKKVKRRTIFRKKSLSKQTRQKMARGKPKKRIKVKWPAKPKKRIKPRTEDKIKKAENKRIFEGVRKTKIRVIGIGGGGSTIVSEIISRIKKADFYVANTDTQALKASAKMARRFQFGQSLTGGLGTGMNAELGEMAAQEEKERIKKLFEGQDFCILIACLGGGTSSGAAPVFAKISKNLGRITYGIFTLPFKFEGEKKMEIALNSLEKIKPNLNIYSVIPNERIFQIIDKNTPLKDALSAINKRLAENLEGLIEMIYSPGLINIDFADLKTILRGRGRLACLNTIEIEEPNREEVIRKLISSPLYPYTIKGATGVLYNITSGKDIQLSEVSQISNIISESINKKAKIIFGISQSTKYHFPVGVSARAGNKIKITLLATGCSAKGFLVKPGQKVLKPLISRAKKFKTKIKRPKIKKKVKKISQPIKKTRAKLKKQSTPRPKSKPKKITSPIKKVKTKAEPSAEISLAKEKPKKRKKKTLSIKATKIKARVKKEKIKSFQPEKKSSSLTLKPSSDKMPPAESLKTKPEQTSNGEKVRRSALQVKKEIEEAEKEILEEEKVWEIPAILRKKQK